MKFGQLIECSMRNIYPEKSDTKCGGERVPDSFRKNKTWAYLWISSFKVLQNLFLFYAKLRAI